MDGSILFMETLFLYMLILFNSFSCSRYAFSFNNVLYDDDDDVYMKEGKRILIFRLLC
jgi:hypothetical protein